MTKLLGKQNCWVFSFGVEVLWKKITETPVKKESFCKPRKFGNFALRNYIWLHDFKFLQCVDYSHIFISSSDFFS